MKFKLRANQKGDTIVEVLIVLAVLSLAFAMSSATANNALIKARNAEEHSQGMGALNSQVEMLHKALSNDQSIGFTDFCMKVVGNSITAVNASNPANCVYADNNLSMNQKITKTGDRYYDVKVTWAGPGATGQQNEEYKYKAYSSGSMSGGGAPSAVYGGFKITSGGSSQPPRQPIISSFTSDKSLIYLRPAGTGSTANFVLSWSATFDGDVSGAAHSCSISGTGMPATNVSAAGSMTIAAVVGARSYTITCKSVAGGVTTQVSSSPVIVSIKSTYKDLYSYFNKTTKKHILSTTSNLAAATYVNEGILGKMNSDGASASANNEKPLRKYTNSSGVELYAVQGNTIPSGYNLVALVGYTAGFSGACPSGTQTVAHYSINTSTASAQDNYYIKSNGQTSPITDSMMPQPPSRPPYYNKESGRRPVFCMY